MKYTVNPKGVCACRIEFEIEDDIVKNIEFKNGCNGNAKGISALADGMSVNDIINKLKGIKCGLKNTSCPDQLAVALEKILKG